MTDFIKKVVYLDFIETSYKKKKNMLLEDADLKHIDTELAGKYCDSLNCGYITCFDSDYPNELKLLHNPPIVLYYMGNKNILQSSKIAVIGSRNNTSYGRRSLTRIMKNIQNLTVVSGMAYGIDQLAHVLSIQNGLQTIAVVGGGLNKIYPQCPEIINKLKKEHLIISEYPPGSKAYPWMFPMRNRIIAALSEKILVIEADIASGSLITVEVGLELNKEVYALPGSIFSKQSRGTNLLLEEGANVLTLDSKF